MRKSSLLIILLSLTTFCVSGCFSPSINGRRLASSNSASAFKTFFKGLVPGFGSVADATGDDQIQGITIDSNGYTYLIGETTSNMFGALSSVNADMIILKLDNAGNQVWAKQLNTAYPGLTSTTGYDTGYEVRVGPNNDTIYLAGYSNGNFAGANSGFQDTVVLKLNASDGSLIWARQLNAAFTGGTPTGSERCYHMAVDSSGNAYLYGTTDAASYTGVFGGGSNDLFVAKVDTNGTFQWARQLTQAVFPGQVNSAAGSESAGYIVVDSGGSVYITGYSDGAFMTATPGGGNDAFLTKMDSAGNIVWTNQLINGYGTIVDASASQYGYRLSTDASGNLYLAGRTSGNFISASGGSGDIFFGKITASTGVPVWWKQVNPATYGAAINSAAGTDYGDGGIGTDSSGNIYVSGSTSGNLFATNGGGALLDLIVFKVDSNGNWIWGKQFVPSVFPSVLDASADDQVESMMITPEGGIVMGGQSASSFAATQQGVTDGFIIHLDKDGNL